MKSSRSGVPTAPALTDSDRGEIKMAESILTQSSEDERSDFACVPMTPEGPIVDQQEAIEWLRKWLTEDPKVSA